MAKRREFTRSQKAQMIQRASDAKGNIRCEGCALNLTGKKLEFDHTIPEAMVVDKSVKLTINDGKVLGECCHRGPEGKTAKDVGDIAKAKRRQAKATGITRPDGKIKSHGFALTAKKISKSATPTKLEGLTPKVLFK
jgi:hypothetical protein